MYQATETLSGRVETGPIGIGALAGAWIAKPTYTSVDDLRIPLRYHLITQAEAVHDAHPHVLDDGVSLIAELQEDVLLGLVFQVEAHAPFVAVDRCEGGPEVGTSFAVLMRRGVVGEKGRNVAVAVTPWRFDLDDPRPEVGEEAGAKRSR